METAHKESMNQFRIKIENEQKAQIDGLKRQMENDKQEVWHLNFSKHGLGLSNNLGE